MKVKRLGLACGVLGFALIITFVWLRHPNDLGLSGFDIAIGGQPDLEALRANTKAVAEAFLSQRKADLLGESDKKYDSKLDYAKTSWIRSLGYRSSYYYYCWDIYLPYSLEPQSGAIRTVIVQLTDSIPGNRHDPQRFHVIRALSLDEKGKVLKRIESQ